MRHQRFNQPFVLFLFGILIGASFFGAKADELEDLYQQRYQKFQENQKQQQELQQKVEELQGKERTLKNQIEYLEIKRHLTELQISETQSKITQLQDLLNAVTHDINQLEEKLSRLQSSINELTAITEDRIRASYETIFISPWQLFFNSRNFNDWLLKYNYLTALQIEDRKILGEMKDAQGEYLAQINQLEHLKNEKEELKAELEVQKALLNKQQEQLIQEKEAKDYLLTITKNEEAEFQRLLEEARREQEAIQQAINEVLRQISGRVLEGTAVKKGEIIGIQGSTGFSTGDHLHFGFYPCGDWSCPIDPSSSLNDGIFSWPLDGYIISQEFGLSSFARTGVYGYDANGNPKGHNGIDLVGPKDSAIKASHDGKVFYAVDGWGGQGAIILDASGYMTIYWHLQPRK